MFFPSVVHPVRLIRSIATAALLVHIAMPLWAAESAPLPNSPQVQPLNSQRIQP